MKQAPSTNALPAVPLGGGSDDREAEPGSGAGVVAAPEALERPLPVGRVEARPLVTDGDERDGHLTAAP